MPLEKWNFITKQNHSLVFFRSKLNTAILLKDTKAVCDF